jgi:hypothetical protein
MPVRKVITRRSSHFRAYLPSLKNGHPTPCESMLEAKFIRLCEISPSVRSYEVQPSREHIRTLHGIERYTPDVRAKFVDGTEGWFEVKPLARSRLPRVAESLRAAKTHFAESGRRFHVITDEWLEVEPRAGNILELMYHRRGVLTPAEKDQVHSTLGSQRPRSLADLFDLFGRDHAWRLLGLGIVGIDLERAITLEVSVYIEGGHRHADFFA